MFETKVLEASDLDKLMQLIALYEDVFEMEGFSLPSKEYLQSLLTREGLNFMVALSNGKVIGGLTAHDLPSPYFEANEVYIYDLAIARDHQRQGVGRKLINDLADLCRQKGDAEIFVQADGNDLDAIEFYRSTGGVQESVFHFSYDAKRAS